MIKSIKYMVHRFVLSDVRELIDDLKTSVSAVSADMWCELVRGREGG